MRHLDDEHAARVLKTFLWSIPVISVVAVADELIFGEMLLSVLAFLIFAGRALYIVARNISYKWHRDDWWWF